MADSVGRRLRQAIERFGPPRRGRPGAKGGIRSFHEAMKKMADAGEIPPDHAVSRQMLHRYLAKEDAPAENQPSEGFLKASAAVLSKAHGQKVSWRWIAFGEGHPTQDVADASGTASAASGSGVEALPSAHQELRDRLLEEFHMAAVGEHGTRANEVPRWIAGVVEAWLRLGKRVEAREDMLIEALKAPMEAMELYPEAFTGRNMDDYIFAITPALIMLAGHRGVYGESSPEKEED